MGIFVYDLDLVVSAACFFYEEEVETLWTASQLLLLFAAFSILLHTAFEFLQGCVYLLLPIPNGQGKHDLPS